MTPYFYENPGIFKINGFSAPEGLRRPDIRITLDTQEDYDLLSRVFQRLYPEKKDFNAYDIVKLFEEKPSLELINKNVVQKEIYDTV